MKKELSDKTPVNESVKQEEIQDYKNPELSIEDRVADLLSKMTLEEKVGQMLCIWGQKQSVLLDEIGNLTLRNLENHFKDGIGQIGRLSDTNGGLNPVEMAELANNIQKYFVNETRLGSG